MKYIAFLMLAVCFGCSGQSVGEHDGRFAGCVLYGGIHYCPEGRYVQIPEDGSIKIHEGSSADLPMIQFGSELDQNTHIANDNSIQIPDNCSVDATGSFNCPTVAPTAKKAPKAPSCSLWLYSPKDGEESFYCGDHEATEEEMNNGLKVGQSFEVYHEGDKDIPKHKSSETKPKVREFYPPDPDKGPQILKASLRILGVN